jgi:hypothetical protein
VRTAVESEMMPSEGKQWVLRDMGKEIGDDEIRLIIVDQNILEIVIK